MISMLYSSEVQLQHSLQAIPMGALILRLNNRLGPAKTGE